MLAHIHIILDMKVTFEICESEGILMHIAVIYSISEFPEFLIL